MKLDLRGYDWIHFEARRSNMATILEMIRRTRIERPKVTISCELEKPRPETHVFLDLSEIDYLFIESDYARLLGFESLADTSARHIKAANVIYVWGESGSKCIQGDGRQDLIPIYRPESDNIVDTLGAGDTLLAATIFGLLVLDKGLPDALRFGSAIAGAKCGILGYNGLERFESILGSSVIAELQL